jgi:hypothetical protein
MRGKRPDKNLSVLQLNKKLHAQQDSALWKEAQKRLKDVVFLKMDLSQITETGVLDVEKLKAELKAAEEAHPFVDKAVKMWKSIPLRSTYGLEGKEGNDGSGINNSPNPDYFEYTTVADHCPYIKQVMESFGAPVLKIRLMKLEGKRTLPEHIDQFRDERIMRFHIPIITYDNVWFYVEKEKQNFTEGTMWFAQVRKHHKVTNENKEPRVHIVFDIWMNDHFIQNWLFPSMDKTLT